jgi:hypothetical protein
LLDSGHTFDEPVQSSAPCEPLAAAQTVPAAVNWSTGQAVDVPEQVSPTSQKPTAARHTAPGFPAVCWHSALVPSHRSAVQGLLSSAHVVFAGFGAHVPAEPMTLHAMHAPEHVVAQQTPSMQCPLKHWLSAVHDSANEGS